MATWLMCRCSFLVTGCLIAGLTQCHGRIDTPQGDSCVSSAPRLADGVEFNLPHLVGTIRLPRGVVGQPIGYDPDARKYILQDSAVLEVWLTSRPAAGLSASGGTKGKFEGMCSGQMGKFPVIVSRASLSRPNGDSLFVGMLNITLDSDQALNVATTAGTRASRDDVLKRLPGFLLLQ